MRGGKRTGKKWGRGKKFQNETTENRDTAPKKRDPVDKLRRGQQQNRIGEKKKRNRGLGTGTPVLETGIRGLEKAVTPKRDRGKNQTEERIMWGGQKRQVSGAKGENRRRARATRRGIPGEEGTDRGDEGVTTAAQVRRGGGGGGSAKLTGVKREKGARAPVSDKKN